VAGNIKQSGLHLPLDMGRQENRKSTFHRTLADRRIRGAGRRQLGLVSA
jgi:hypothetical protein